MQVIFDLLEAPNVERGSCSVSDLKDYCSQRKINGAKPPIFVLEDEVNVLGDKQIRLVRNVFRAARLLVVLMGTNISAANLVTKRALLFRGELTRELRCVVISSLPTCTESTLEILGFNEEMKRVLSAHSEFWRQFVLFFDKFGRECLPWFACLVVQKLKRLMAGESMYQLSTQQPTPFTGRSDPVSSGSSSDMDVDDANTANYLPVDLGTCLLTLDCLFDACFQEIVGSKTQVMSREGLRGQLALQLNMYHLDDQVQSYSSDEIASYISSKQTNLYVGNHFSKPVHPMERIFIDSTTGILVAQREPGGICIPWKPMGVFSTCYSDPILHLLMGGQPIRVRASELANQHLRTQHTQFTYIASGESHRRQYFQLSAHSALYEVQHGWFTSAPSMGLNAGNKEAIARDGDLLECLSVIAVTSASRTNGLRGTTVIDFFADLVGQLRCDPTMDVTRLTPTWLPDTVIQNDNEFRRRFGLQRIPYLSASNSHWPEELLGLPGVLLGDFSRSSTTEKIDFRAVARQEGGLSFTGECKNYSIPIPGKVLREILKHVCVESTFHLVLVDSLQKTYFQSPGTTTDSFADVPRFRRMNIAKLSVSVDYASRPPGYRGHFDTFLTLVPVDATTMPWVDWEACDVLVVFVELKHLPHRPLHLQADEERK